MFTIPLLQSACFLTRNLHSFPGRWRVVDWITRHRKELQRCGHKTVRLAPGYKLKVPPGDSQGWTVYTFGWNPRDELTMLFQECLESGDNMLDIGANNGYYTVVASRLVGARGTVHSFEASPRMCKLLRDNVMMNPCDNVTVHEIAVSNHAGSVTFHEAPDGLSGLGSLRDLGAETNGVTTVDSVAIDSMLDSLPPIKLAKIDVEGADYLVLQGMQALIERDHPVLISEFNPAWFAELGASGDEVYAFLRDRGYDVFEIAKPEPIAVNAAPREACNILCLPT